MRRGRDGNKTEGDLSFQRVEDGGVLHALKQSYELTRIRWALCFFFVVIAIGTKDHKFMTLAMRRLFHPASDRYLH